MKTAKEVRHNPFSLVENLPESRKEPRTTTAAQKQKVNDCKLQTYRIEVNSSDGNSLHYGLRAANPAEARNQAITFISDMAFAFQDDRLAWRLAGDRHWSFQGAVKEKKSLLRKIGEFFFIFDEEQQIN